MTVIENLEGLLEIIKTTNNSVITIKSRIFFEIIEKNKILHREFRLCYPPTQIGSGTVFELTILAAMLNIFESKKIVEIGTYIGFSTSALALNSRKNASIYTIDLPDLDVDEHESRYDRQILIEDWRKNDEFLRRHQNLVGSYYIDQLDKEFREKIQRIKCDSTKLDENVLNNIKDADLFFIDGGHAFDIIKCDTETALKSLHLDGWIVWHDYKSKTHTEVTQFIDEHFSINHLVLHVENTMLALHAPNLLQVIERLQELPKL